MKIVLAVDGGGTHTECLAMDRAGHVLGRGDGGPSNHLIEPAPVVARSLADAAREALAAASLGMGDVECLAAGLSGVDYDGTGGEDAAGILASIGFRDALIYGDMVIAHRGALGGRAGTMALAGTGSVFLAIDDAGRMTKCGGWGPIYGDEGSAYWIAVEALRAVARAADLRKPPSPLTTLLFERLGISTAFETVQRVYCEDMPRPQMAALSEVVDCAAEQGDPAAISILERAGAELADGAAAATEAAGLNAPGCLISFQGSLLRHSRTTRAAFLGELAARLPGCQAADPLHPPVHGAYWLACRALGWSQ